MDSQAVLRDLRCASLRGDVVGPDDGDYGEARRVWNATADRRPGAIVRAVDRHDVSRVLAIAAERGALLAVRGGGHSLPGLSTCDGGILLDLSRLNEVSIDTRALRAEVGGGALLRDLDGASVQEGLVVPAGIVSHTGVAGLTLGGGMGWLSRRFGLTIDSLVAAEIVTADGLHRRIGPTEEADLFWAIRGGGGNFGVVTRFVFRLHRLGGVMIGVWTYPFERMKPVLKRYGEMIADVPPELTTAISIAQDGLRMTAVWSGDLDKGQALVMSFGKLDQAECVSFADMSYIELQQRADEQMCWGRRYYAKGGFLKTIGSSVVDMIVDGVARAPSRECGVYVLQLGGAVSEIDDEATAYTGRAAGHYWLVDAGWDAADDDVGHTDWCRSLSRDLGGASMSGNYVNEQGDAGNEIARAAYGEAKYARLARIKATYDPGNLFRLNQNIVPKA